ncbi:MAG: RpiB/LacA/LacB family sugar-phosphate isomerase [Clostridium sp.]|mgnify:FL=1|uniref:RpiB/LacA/LacB family sugar-phosphate isomerase n=1 Tax=Clostridium sp. TaxID=1506 RepID=UPI0025BDDD64|nr:RpiB/LacA/LacB family sugar-phosphate isomerase [Clostridium sp.]MDY2629987.1 RpiB/LacA/LacB family sugar-phosphate isomerase [Clostridium sp.]MDY6226584.1 RpiB/LacA/LacB family sugar-phosphate isomerase [Clostridium sp.]
MKVAIIQGSSQKDKNSLVDKILREILKGKDYEVINFGIFKDEDLEYSYVEIAMLISILLESKAVDFVVTGCSSGQGMMLACNSLPSIICGYVENPSDAYLFGRINNGNAVSIPLGLNFGWAAEINLQCILEKLFDEPFGVGYPKEEAKRKQKDANILKHMNYITKRELKNVIPKMDVDFMKKVLSRDNVFKYVMKYGQNNELKKLLQTCK